MRSVSSQLYEEKAQDFQKECINYCEISDILVSVHDVIIESVIIYFWMFFLTGVFRDNRVIIVITKFDLVNQSFDEDEVTEGKVKEQTCQFVAKACPGATILPDDVLPVSGRWAYNARMLANTGPEEPNHNRCQTAVKNCLRHVPNATCGQGEDPNMSLDKLGDDVLSAKLEEASGIIALEERYFQ